MTTFVNYRFMKVRPGRHKLRDGTWGTDSRTKYEWEQAFEGHVRSAHDGVMDKNCNGCRELKKKVEGLL